jgi:hypothetical protein
VTTDERDGCCVGGYCHRFRCWSFPLFWIIFNVARDWTFGIRRAFGSIATHLHFARMQYAYEGRAVNVQFKKEEKDVFIVAMVEVFLNLLLRHTRLNNLDVMLYFYLNKND